MLKGKHILIGVTGGIAAYKTPDLISKLRKQGALVKVVMTKSACEFVTPLTFRTMSQNPVACEMFDDPAVWEVAHISLAKWADLLYIVPATANIIAKIAAGIADDMLSTVALATKAPLLIAPAMNTAMFENRVTQENIKKLKDRGVLFAEPDCGNLACGDSGKGKLPGIDRLLYEAVAAIGFSKDFTGKRILITAGATQEAIDPVRYITNHSSGKMGYALAAAAHFRGAEVTLISGKTALTAPYGVNFVEVTSAEEMYHACMDIAPSCDVVIKAAAVADYRPETVSAHKMKKGDGDLTISLTRNKDILKELGENKRDGQILAGFCMETQNLIENAQRKLEEKNLDLICANSLTEPGAGFATDTNTITLLTRKGEKYALPNMSKFEAGMHILDEILKLNGEG